MLKIVENEEFLRQAAISNLKKFFKGKKDVHGQLINLRQMCCEKYVTFVMDTDIIKSCDIFYKKMQERKRPRNIKNVGSITWDIQLYQYGLSKVKMAGIPKCFQGGIILLFFRYCKGIL